MNTTEYYLEPSCPQLDGPAIPARMKMLITAADGSANAVMEPVILYPEGYGYSPGGRLVKPVAILATEASPAAHAAVRGHVVGWCRPL